MNVDPDARDGMILLDGAPGTGSVSFRVSMTVDRDAAIEAARKLYRDNPDFAEDLRSLTESAPFVIRLDESRGLMSCERCRVMVISVPEALSADPPESRKWNRAIWEAETGRKHALRRCEAMQGSAG